MTNVSLFAPHLKGDGCGDMFEDDSFVFMSPKTSRLLPSRSYSGLMNWQVLIELFRAIKKHEVIHLSYCREFLAPLAFTMALFMRKGIILQTHGMLTSRTSRGLKLYDALVSRPQLMKAGRVIALTEVEVRNLTRTFGRLDNVVPLANPLLFRLSQIETLRNASRRNEFIFLGRLESRKRIMDLAAAAEILELERVPWKVCVVGPDQGELEKVRSAEKNLINFSYEGAIPLQEVAQRLAQSKAFVLPSINEPWGNTLTLALSLGVPVIVTKSAALAPAVNSYGAGLVVADGKPVELARAMKQIADASRQEYQKMAESAVLLSGNLFNENQIREQLWALMEELVPIDRV
jgi:glycosyltransferase involved in cell wall biosynthesis